MRINSDWLRNMPWCGRQASVLSQVTTARHVHPATCKASEVKGSCLQSEKTISQPPCRVILIASCIHMTDHKKWVLWSLVSLSKERYLEEDRYFRAGEALRSAVVRPPEAYGGAVTTA